MAACSLALALGCGASAQDVPVRNGFALYPAAVPADQILAGGPPRDGIPALDHPKTLPADESPWDAEAVVIGVQVGDAARAYPIAILNWHELVNDTLGDEPILVSYCPLCGTGIVFDRRVGDQARRFGVSGLLYNSDLLLYDRETESLWSQISAEAVTGPSLGQRLRSIRSRMMSWAAWKRAHPETTVLAPETGHRRPYDRSPYQGYAQSDELAFPVPLDRRYHPKMPTLGLRRAKGPARAYPALELVRAGGRAAERFDGEPVSVAYDPDTQVFEVEAPADVEVIEGYWFAWMAFHPESSVFRAGDSDREPGASEHRAPPDEGGTER